MAGIDSCVLIKTRLSAISKMNFAERPVLFPQRNRVMQKKQAAHPMRGPYIRRFPYAIVA